MKIAIYGAGAMGTVLGALLTKGGCKEVELITRNQLHADGMKRNGATLVCEAENTEWNIPVNAITPSEMQGKYDIVFLMTKQRENKDILRFLLPYLHENSVICTTQNGLPEQMVAEIVGNDRAYGGVASFGATFIGGGKVKLTSKFQGMRMQIGGYQNDGRYIHTLKEVLSFVGKAVDNPNFVEVTDNLAGARWSKLCINSAFSGLSVITGKNFGEIAKKRKSRKIALALLREGMSVADGLGVTLEKMQGHDMKKMLGGKSFFKRAIAYILLPIAMKKHKKLYSGMLKDIQKGRRCEIDFINGVVVDAGKTLGVPTPYNQKIVEITHGIENGLYEISLENLDFFNE